jgi:pimeloyl-ACP methyl ester carboxylesterase
MLCDAEFWRAQTDAFPDAIVWPFGLLDSFDAMAGDVLARAPERFALAGHSMGGRVALEICRRAPQRVTRLALLCTDYRGPKDDEERRSELLQRRALLAEARAAGLEEFARGWALANVAPRNAQSTLLSRIEKMASRRSLETLAAQTFAALNRRDQTQVLAALRCPTLVCAGEEDRLRPAAAHRDMAERIAASRLVVVEGAGHMAPMERPEAVTQAMREWAQALAGA